MTYNELLSQIKGVYIERLESIVPNDAYLANPDIPKSVYLDSVYTDIMALGYNFNNAKKAVDDIYETQSLLHGHSTQLLKSIKQRVEETANLYPKEIRAFSEFHKMTQSGEDFDKAIDVIRHLLEIN
ncbi:hypothetical protein [Niastella populi]|nr:hypothetical protein [Niastella populi]